MPKISVIIPVYGVEKYIERCSRSLFEQTLDDIEYIFINDCTPDKSIDILASLLKEYPHRRKAVKIIEMNHNSGQAAVRNKGIELATGDYVIHCDSDDYVNVDMYRTMWEKALDTSADIVICGANEYYPDGTHLRHKHSVDDIDLLTYILSSPWGGTLWNKLVKREIVQDTSIIMPNDNFWEDLALTVQYSLRCKKWAHISQELYNYCRREDSIIGSSNSANNTKRDHTIQASQNYDIVVKAIKQSGKESQYKQLTIRRQLFIKNQLLPLMPFKGCTSLWRSLCHKSNWQILFSPYISNKEKAAFLITYFGLYSLLARFKF